MGEGQGDGATRGQGDKGTWRFARSPCRLVPLSPCRFSPTLRTNRPRRDPRPVIPAPHAPAQAAATTAADGERDLPQTPRDHRVEDRVEGEAGPERSKRQPPHIEEFRDKGRLNSERLLFSAAVAAFGPKVRGPRHGVPRRQSTEWNAILVGEERKTSRPWHGAAGVVRPPSGAIPQRNVLRVRGPVRRHTSWPYQCGGCFVHGSERGHCGHWKPPACGRKSGRCGAAARREIQRNQEVPVARQRNDRADNRSKHQPERELEEDEGNCTLATRSCHHLSLSGFNDRTAPGHATRGCLEREL